MKILAIGAHPDDIEIFMFGLLTLFKERGDEIYLMIATDGSLGGANKGELLKNKRKLEAYTTEDIKKILEAVHSTKFKKAKLRNTTRNTALIHFLASTGQRIGSFYWLRVKDLEKIENCYCVKVYARTIHEYLTFLTPQATKALDAWLESDEFQSYEEIDKHGNVIQYEERRIFHLSHDTIRTLTNRIVRRAKIEITFDGKRYNKPVNHAFRYRWNTVFKMRIDTNPNLIEKLLGHTLIKLDESYLKVTKENLFLEFKKGIDDLTIR